MSVPISAFIITKNEEVRLGRTLAALKGWVDEIVVVDSGSADRTLEIAREAGARVFHRDWTGYGPQKRFAEQQCRNDWVLNVDADEVVTPELAKEIQALLSKPDGLRACGYKVKILTVYPGDTKPRSLARDYNVVRLYHRSIAYFRDHPIHDRVIIKNNIVNHLQYPIYHFPYISFEHVIAKHNRFSTFHSKCLKNRNKYFLILRLIFEFPLNFLKFYIFRGHFTGGWKGFYFSSCHAFMRTSRIAKMLEQRSEAQGHRLAVAVTSPSVKILRDASRLSPH